VGSRVVTNGCGVAEVGDVVTASFVYPAPILIPSELTHEKIDIVREGFENAIAGMFHLALMFRCGAAGIKKLTSSRMLCLTSGPNEVWNDRYGFRPKAHDLLREGRPLGSSNRK